MFESLTTKPGLEILCPCDHGRLILYALRAEDERHAALLCERHGELLAGDGLHNGGSQRDVERNRGSSPFLYLTRGVLSDTFAGTHSLDE